MLKQFMLAAGLAVFAPSCLLAAQDVAPNQSPAPPLAISPSAPKTGESVQLGKQDANRTLAQKLSELNGTIYPPPVDPGMDKLPPETGTMPVVKPPPNVQSK